MEQVVEGTPDDEKSPASLLKAAFDFGLLRQRDMPVAVVVCHTQRGDTR